MNQIAKKTPKNLHYLERSVFMKEVNTQNFWTFELGTQEGINVPIWIFVVFQKSDRQRDQNLNNDTFNRMPFASAQVVVGTEKYPDSGILLNYTDDDYSQGYGLIKKLLKLLQKMIYSNHIYLKMTSDRLIMVMILIIIKTLSIFNLRKTLKMLNQ